MIKKGHEMRLLYMLTPAYWREFARAFMAAARKENPIAVFVCGALNGAAVTWLLMYLAK